MGSALALSGQARVNIKHGLEGDERRGSMSLIYSVPDEIMAEASVALSAICTLASAILLHRNPSMTGSERWDPQVMLEAYRGLEPYEHNAFGGVEQRVAGAAGVRETRWRAGMPRTPRSIVTFGRADPFAKLRAVQHKSVRAG